MPASLHREINFPSHLQEKFANRHFISLTNSEFLDYAGVELLLIPKNKPNLINYEKDLQICLQNTNPDNLVKELAKINPPETLASLEK